MAVLYSNYQDQRKNSSKLFYARAIHPSTVGLDYIADRIQHNCSMTKGDTLAVLTELVTVMKDELQNSNKVKLDGFGTFYLNISTKGAASEDEFSITECLKGVHCRFLAEGKKSNGVLTRTFSDDVQLKKASGFQSGTSSSSAKQSEQGVNTNE